MNQTLLTAGIACMIAAIVGGGLKAFAIEIPLLNSVKRQVILGIFGVAMILSSRIYYAPSSPAASESGPGPSVPAQTPPGSAATSSYGQPAISGNPVQPVASSEPSNGKLSKAQTDSLLSELKQNNEVIESLKAGMATHAGQIEIQQQKIEEQRKNISDVNGMIVRGEGTPAEVARAQQAVKNAERAIKEAQDAIDEAKQTDARANDRIISLKVRNQQIEDQLKQ